MTYFERKEPSDATVDLWFQAVRDVPAEALPWLYRKLIELEAFPRNLPGFMLARAREWRAGNPHRQPRDYCECHSGVWEVAFWRPELGEWAIFTIPCGRCSGQEGPRQIFDLDNRKLYDREPDRYMAEPPDWALIYPEKDSLRKKTREILDYLKNRKQGRPPANNLDLEAALPF